MRRTAGIALAVVLTSVGSIAWVANSAGAAATAGAGVADADVVTQTTYDNTYEYTRATTTVTYPLLHLFGHLDVGGQSFDGWGNVVGLHWSYEEWLCWDPFGLPGPGCAFVTPPSTGTFAYIEPGFTLLGTDTSGSHHLGGSCGGSGSSVSVTADEETIHLGCTVSFDGGPGQWTRLDFTLAPGGPPVSAPYIAGTYVASTD